MWKALIKLVEKWSYRCDHNFELIKTTQTFASSDSKLPYKGQQIYFCKKCGEHKIVKY